MSLAVSHWLIRQRIGTHFGEYSDIDGRAPLGGQGAAFYRLSGFLDEGFLLGCQFSHGCSFI